MDLCKYKNVFGEPGKSVHKHFLGIAWVDVISTIIGAIFVSYVFKLDIWYSLLILFLLGIILHRLFCVRTTVDKFLFP
jgi:hypothetical protein